MTATRHDISTTTNSKSPTDSFTIFEPRNMSIVTCELHKVRRSPDFEALKLGKGPSVRVFTVIPTTSFEILEAAGRVVLSSKVLFTLIPANREAFSFSFSGKFRPGLWISGFFFFSLLFYVFCYAIPNKLSLGSFFVTPFSIRNGQI